MHDTLYNPGDFLDALEEELTVARTAAAKAVDRAEALVELRSRAIAVSEELRRPLRPEDLQAHAGSEQERAEIAALVARAERPTN